ncbi:MFS transporter [Oceanobacter antarcticus]|jgi:MFS family permease|uniref:MFS transporter n=1 Tax=Oceanobacter antarcticus TaxID=3133425 RepID=A0ABW8NHC1_9GAMM|tara:strand:- start:127 stop:1365 length:1239 start_codon:yes stop_codon:yes gene_type:complete
MNVNTYENRLLLILFVCFGFVFFDRLALSFLFPFVAADLNLNNSHLGMLSSVLALMWALSGMTLGHIADKKESKKYILVISVIAFTLCSALSGLVTTFVSLLIFRGLMGIAEGPVLPISQSLLAAASNPKRRGLNMGLVNASAPGLIGAIIAPPILIWLATDYGWRTAFYATLVPGLIIAALIMLFVRNKHVHESMAATHHLGGKGDIKALLKNRNILLCVLISCFYISWFITLISFTPTFLMQARGFAPDAMGGIMGSLGFAWMIWGFVISALSDRFGRKPMMILFTLIATACPMVLLYADADSMLPLVFLTYTGLGCFTLFMATIPAETVPASQVATALGLIMGVGELFGGFITPTVAGFMADAYGLDIVMWIASAGSLIAMVLALFLKETAPAKVGHLTATEALATTHG